ncbi:MAG: hypothetical protein JW894_01185 [Bacteroidales bacterium]|nr:hypothetical protein [Bacteroidales bacterium]
MKKIWAILCLMSVTFAILKAQGEIDDEEKIFYRNERTFAGTIASTGFGFNFRYAKRLDAFRKTTYEAGFNFMKHEKEFKITTSQTQQIGGSYVYGKLNSLYTLYGGIGFQREIFRKEDQGGISIRYFYNFGPVIGLQKPVYYEVWVLQGYIGDQPVFQIERMKFEDHLLIDRKAPFYIGFNELSVVPGGYFKFGFSFEYSKKGGTYRALETGIIVDAFVKEIPIMANDQNHWLFPGFFLNYRFGKIIDSQFKRRKTKVDEMLTD